MNEQQAKELAANRRYRVKEANQERLVKYQNIALAQQPPQTVQWPVVEDFTSWKPTGESDE